MSVISDDYHLEQHYGKCAYNNICRSSTTMGNISGSRHAIMCNNGSVCMSKTNISVVNGSMHYR